MKPAPSSNIPTADALAVGFAIVFPTLITWVYFVALAGAEPALQQTAYTAGKVLQFAFPLLWVIVAHRRRPAFRWPSGKGIGKGLVFGAAVSAGILLGYFGWLKPAGHLSPGGVGMAIHLKVARFGVSDGWSYAAMGGFYCVCHSLLEEYYWRWFVFGQLKRRIPLGLAIAASSIAFMAHHVLVLGFYFGWTSPEAVLFSLAVAVGGTVWAWIYHQSGSLYAIWLSHLLVDAAIFTVGYDLVRPFLASSLAGG